MCRDHNANYADNIVHRFYYLFVRCSKYKIIILVGYNHRISGSWHAGEKKKWKRRKPLKIDARTLESLAGSTPSLYKNKRAPPAPPVQVKHEEIPLREAPPIPPRKAQAPQPPIQETSSLDRGSISSRHSAASHVSSRVSRTSSRVSQSAISVESDHDAILEVIFINYYPLFS